MASFPFPNKISQDSKHMMDQKHLISNYGDGVQQRAAVGVNARVDMWTIALNNLSVSERNTMVAFFDSHGFIESFDWTPPNGAATKWVFTSPLEESNTALVYHFNFSLQQVFE